MSESIHAKRAIERSKLLNKLKQRLHQMIKVHGDDFRYDFAIVMTQYLKKPSEMRSFRKFLISPEPSDRFLVTILREILEFSKTEAETVDIFFIFFLWVVGEFRKDNYEKLKGEERETPQIFIGANSTKVH